MYADTIPSVSPCVIAMWMPTISDPSSIPVMHTTTWDVVDISQLHHDTPLVVLSSAKEALAPTSATQPSSKIAFLALTDALARKPMGADSSACVIIIIDVSSGSSALGIICVVADMYCNTT